MAAIQQTNYKTKKCDSCGKYIFPGEYFFRTVPEDGYFKDNCSNCTSKEKQE